METVRRVQFANCTVDLLARELYCGRERVALQEKPFRLLEALLERPGDVITRDELGDALWPEGTHVEREAGLNTAARKLRAALRQHVPDGDILETVPRVGYRLRAEVEVLAAEPAAAVIRGAASRRVQRMAPIAVAAALALLAFLAVADGEPPAAAARTLPIDADSRTAYLEARTLLAEGRQLERVRDLLDEVIASEPDFAPAYGHLAETSARIALAGGSVGDLAIARSALDRAREVLPDAAIAERAAAMLALHFDWDIVGAAAGLERALTLDPEDPVNYLAIAMHRSVVGRHEEAIGAARRAVSLAPESMAVRSDTGYFLLRAGRFDEAIAECELVLRIDAHDRFAHECLLLAHSQRGDDAAARTHALELMRRGQAVAAELTRVESGDARRGYARWRLSRLRAAASPQPVSIATAYLVLNDIQQVLHWLERAVEARDPDLVLVPADINYASMYNDERFRNLLQRAGLPLLRDRVVTSAARPTDPI